MDDTNRPPDITEFLLARIAYDEWLASRLDAMHEPNVDLRRVQAECKAKRRTLELLPEMSGGDWVLDYGEEILKAMAAVYVDHPDYRPEWAV